MSRMRAEVKTLKERTRDLERQVGTEVVRECVCVCTISHTSMLATVYFLFPTTPLPRTAPSCPAVWLRSRP